MKIRTTAALVATLLALASPAVLSLASPAIAEGRVAEAIALADACVPAGMLGADFVPSATCTAEQRRAVADLAGDIAILLTLITAGDKMTTDAIRECTASNAEVKAMTACLAVKTEAMQWMANAMPAFDFHQQLIFGGCAIDNGSAVKAEVDLVATVACYKAHA